MVRNLTWLGLMVATLAQAQIIIPQGTLPLYYPSANKILASKGKQLVMLEVGPDAKVQEKKILDLRGDLNEKLSPLSPDGLSLLVYDQGPATSTLYIVNLDTLAVNNTKLNPKFMSVAWLDTCRFATLGEGDEGSLAFFRMTKVYSGTHFEDCEKTELRPEIAHASSPEARINFLRKQFEIKMQKSENPVAVFVEDGTPLMLLFRDGLYYSAKQLAEFGKFSDIKALKFPSLISLVDSGAAGQKSEAYLVDLKTLQKTKKIKAPIKISEAELIEGFENKLVFLNQEALYRVEIVNGVAAKPILIQRDVASFWLSPKGELLIQNKNGSYAVGLKL